MDVGIDGGESGGVVMIVLRMVARVLLSDDGDVDGGKVE